MSEDKDKYTSVTIVVPQKNMTAVTHVFLACQQCGSLVVNETNHDQFHENIDELIDWARDVSQHFTNQFGTPPETVESGNDGKHGSEHGEGEQVLVDNDREEFELPQEPVQPN